MSIPVHIVPGGAYCLIADLSEKQEKIIQSTFTIRNKNIMGYFDVIKYYSYKNANGKACIVFPRFGPLFLNKKLKMVIKTNIPPGCKVVYTLTAKFAGNQEAVFKEIFKRYFDKQGLALGMSGAIINLEAGQGKTFLGLHIIAKLQLKTFIIVHNELILNQWVKVINGWMDNCKVGQWYAKKKVDGDITIGIINSAFSYDNWSKIGLCIFDEAHLYCSKKRSEIFKICQSTYMLGLSATPDEKKEKQDNTYKIIQWEIGPILDASKLKNYVASAVPFQGSVKMIKYRGHPNHIETQINEKLEMVSNPKMMKQLTEDLYRIQLVAKLARDIMHNSPKTNLFIFAGRRSYLEEIHKHLEQSQFLTCEAEEKMLNLKTDADADSDPDPNYSTGANADSISKITTIMGQSHADEVEQAEINSRIILTTYQYFGTGKSIPRMNAMILATPFKTGSKQYINRIFRLGSDYSIVRQIVDIVDWSTTLKSMWYWRKRYYVQKQYPITIQEVKWSEFADQVPLNIENGDNGESENGESDNGESENGESDNGESDNGESDNGESENGESENGKSDNKVG